jgi:NADH-quinone oxidoreductase subunit L
MQHLLQFFVLIPLLGFVVSLLVPRKKERAISLTAIFTAVLYLATLVAFIVAWLIQNGPVH